MRTQRHTLDIHEFNGTFNGQGAFFRMTSVIGHVMSIDFPPQYQSWDKTDPATLFGAPTLKGEANPKVITELKSEGKIVFVAYILQRRFCIYIGEPVLSIFNMC